MYRVEVGNIYSSARNTVRTDGRVLTRGDVFSDGGEHNRDRVTTVPRIIRTSYAYKRTHYLNLKAMGDALGPPQLFLTFSCDDVAHQFEECL